MPQQTPKLYAITCERFPESGGEGYLDSEYRVFDSKRAAERYAREVVAYDNQGLEEHLFVTFKDVRLVRDIDGRRIQLIPPKRRRSSS